MSLRAVLFASALLTILSAGLHAQVNATTGALNMPPNSFIQWVVDINFGNTPHTEQFTLQLATTETGFRVDMYDIAGMARAANTTGWQDRAPFWNFPTQAAGSYNLTYNAGPYPTLSLSGIHRFVIEITNPNPTLQNTMTFTLGNGSATTASVSGTPFFHPVTLGPSSGMATTVVGTAATALVEHSAQFAFGACTLGSATDEVRFEFEVAFPAGGAAAQVGLFAIADVGTNQIVFDLYSLGDTGGQTPSLSIPLTAQAAAVQADAKSFLTGTHSGAQKFRVVVRAGTPYTGTHLVNFIIVWDLVATLGPAPSTPAVQDQPPVTIAPPGTTITTDTPLTAAGGTPTVSYSWSITGVGATLSGTSGPTVDLQMAGSGQVTVRVENGATGEWAEEVYIVAGPALVVTGPATLPNGMEGTAYGPATMAASGGNPPYTWSQTGLPSGVDINPTSGEISGTPMVNGVFASVIITVTDSAMVTANETYSITIDPPIPPVDISTASLPDGQVGTNYSETVACTGGTAPYTGRVTGTLPVGLTLGTSTTNSVTISGMPNTPGSYNFTVNVSDAAGGDSQMLSIVIDPAPPPPLSIDTVSLAAGTENVAYSESIQASGGVSPYAWTVVGTLPPGLSLNGSTTSTVTLSGTPTADGAYNFSIEVADSTSATDVQAFSINIAAAQSPGPTAPTSSSGGGGCMAGMSGGGVAVAVGLLLVAWRRRSRSKVRG